MPVKELKFEVKEMTGNAGEFVGLASVFGNVDATGDLVEHGAFTKTLAEQNGKVPVLWAHDTAAIVGIGQLSETPQGLEIRGQLVLDSNETAQKAYALMKAGAVRGLSIGYDAVKHVIKNGVRILQEVKLYEVSLTAFPANEQALITAVKADTITAAMVAAGKAAMAAGVKAEMIPAAMVAAGKAAMGVAPDHSGALSAIRDLVAMINKSLR